jgi:chemotaxis protein CheZ
VNDAPARDARQQMVRRVRAALWAIEHDDEAAWRAHVDALIAWRNQPLVQGLARLAQELSQALGDGAPSGIGQALPDACARLEHVVCVSEDASHRTLGMIEECRALLGCLPPPQSAQQAEALAGIRSRLAEMTAAQGYQDLNGQILLRVVDLVRQVHAGLGGALGEARPLQLRAPGHGHGPAVAGLDNAPATQDEANQLLSSLGL